MRLAKEAGETFYETGGHSPDPVLAKFHFCNVNREDDRVTKWIHQRIRYRGTTRPLSWMTVQLLMCRVFNEPATLDYILPYRDEQMLRDQLQKLTRRGQKLLRGAYLMVPHGEGETVESYFAPAIATAMQRLTSARVSYANTIRLESVAELLQDCPGVGPFIANQVCTDLRYVSNHWRDWTTFVLAGPGTRRGLNRYYGRIIRGPGSRPEGGQATCARELLRIREDAPPWLSKTFRDINNLSNCFCEFDKYQRAQDQIAAGEVPSLKRNYTPYDNPHEYGIPHE